MRRRSWTPRRAIPALALGVLVVVLVIFPIGRLAIVAWTEGRGILPELAAEPGLGRAVTHTILLAAAVTVAAVPMGTAAALGLARADVPGRRGWRLALLLPIVVPDYVLGFSWTEAYGIGGFTDVLADRPWSGVNSAVGVWAALTVGAVPLTICLVVAAGLSARAEPSLVGRHGPQGRDRRSCCGRSPCRCYGRPSPPRPCSASRSACRPSPSRR